MKDFKCNICHRVHPILNSFTCPIPTQVTDLYDEHDTGRVIPLSSNSYLINKSYLIIKGEIKLEVQSSLDDISILAWCSIPNESFRGEFISLKEGKEIMIEGQLISELPFYEKSLGLQIDVKMVKSRELGIIRVTENCQLKTDQLSPISKTRIIELMQNVYHLSDSNKDIENLDQTLSSILNHAQTEFIDKGKKFLINVIYENIILFQLISSEFLEEPKPFTFGLHIANDSSNDNYLTVKSQMKNHKHIKEYSVDGVEIYQSDYEGEKNQLVKDVRKLTKDLFQIQIDNCKFEISEP
ncbi:DUF2199 domain-containing protein [Portibacter marinus]|uniref:DUF2199 domain-containing protein n=1 Tax=Portibacter marinus TaxID=2898660 RepID=UPI001F3E5A3C|nr:DUF2199 domain-containing protein [Portibacter marinus]